MRVHGSRGQILVIALLIMSILAITVPLLIMYADREAKWSTLQKRSTTAFHLAEAATERAYLQVVKSTTVYRSILNGGTLSGYNFDTAYYDIAGGSYTIKISSGYGTDLVKIIGVGKDSGGGLVRAVEVIYADAKFGDVAVYANGGVNVTGNNFTVEWGAIMTPKSITTGNLPDSPQLFSAGSISEDTNGVNPPNCDSPSCCWWHSYDSNIPAAPTIDFDFYKSSAQATSTYYTGTQSFAINNTTNKTYFFTGNFSMGANSYLKGNLIVLGDLNAPSGNWGTGSPTVKMPTKAWKQYCLNWTYYKNKSGGGGNGYWEDTSAAASFPGLTSTYSSDSSYTVTIPNLGSGKTAVYGFMYVGGNVNWGGGGGNADFVGVVYINGNAALGANSHATIWYNGDIASGVATTTVNLQRASWREIKQTWPL